MFSYRSAAYMVMADDDVREGAPSSIDTTLDSVSAYVVNNIILISFSNGTSVLALVAMIPPILTFVKNVGWGCLYSSEPLYGIMNGERDPAAAPGVLQAFRNH